MSRTIGHVVWDWNGTLLDDASQCVEALNGVLRSHGLPAVSLDDYRRRFKFPVREYYENLGFDFVRDDWDAVTRDFTERYRALSGTAALRSGARETLDSLGSSGMPMSVLSAAEDSHLRRMVEDHGLAHYFDSLHGLGDAYAHSKLGAGRRMVSGIGLPPASILVVGDTVHDYEVAMELGCACVLIRGGHQDDFRIERCGCDVLADIARVVRYVACRRAVSS